MRQLPVSGVVAQLLHDRSGLGPRIGGRRQSAAHPPQGPDRGLAGEQASSSRHETRRVMTEHAESGCSLLDQQSRIGPTSAGDVAELLDGVHEPTLSARPNARSIERRR